MTENSAPELTLLETVAQLAAEAATRTVLPRLEALETAEPAPAPVAAVPPALASRLDAMENALRLLIESPPAPAPLAADDRQLVDDLRLAISRPPAPAPLTEADRRTIDDLRLANAENTRHLNRLLEKETS